MALKEIFASGSIDELRKWICATSPRGENAIFDIVLVCDGKMVRVSSNLPQEKPAFDYGCLQDILLAMRTQELVREGELELDGGIGLVLDELSGEVGQRITLRDLLNHSSGLWILNAPDPDPAIAQWDSLVARITETGFKFPPSTQLVYSIIERILLVHLLSKKLERNIYAELVDRIRLIAPGIGSNQAPPDQGMGLRNLAGPIEDLALFLRDGMPQWWLEELRSGEDEFAFLKFPCEKAAAPVAIKMGMLRFANGLWGQNGQSVSGSLGLRLVPESGDFALGWFPTQFERDLAMGILGENLRGQQAMIGDPVMGELGDFSVEELCGQYAGLMIKQVNIAANNGNLEFKINGGEAGQLNFGLMPDGKLVSRMPHPSLWIEPFRHPLNNSPCLRMGMSLFIKDPQ